MKISEFKKLIREEVQNVLKEIQIRPNGLYSVEINVGSGFKPSEIKKLSGDLHYTAVRDGLKTAIENLKKSGNDLKSISKIVKAYLVDSDTYYIRTGKQTVTIMGSPKAKTYGQFWSLLDAKSRAAANMYKKMDAEKRKSNEVDLTGWFDDDTKVSKKVSKADPRGIKWNYPDVESDDFNYEYNPEDDSYSIMAPITGVDASGKKYTGLYLDDVEDVEELDDLDVDYKKIKNIKKK